jgi:hypothetical protein
MFHVLRSARGEIRINLKLVTSARGTPSGDPGNVEVEITLAGGDNIEITIKDNEWTQFTQALDSLK